MTQPMPQEEWHILIFKSKASFGIGSFLDKILQMETGDTLFEIVPVKIPYSAIPPMTTPVIVPPPAVEPPSPPPVVPPPPAYPPLWTGTAIGVFSIRDEAGNKVDETTNGQIVSVYAENVTAGQYANRVVISHPLEKNRNVWREGVKRT